MRYNPFGVDDMLDFRGCENRMICHPFGMDDIPPLCGGWGTGVRGYGGDEGDEVRGYGGETIKKEPLRGKGSI